MRIGNDMRNKVYRVPHSARRIGPEFVTGRFNALGEAILGLLLISAVVALITLIMSL